MQIISLITDYGSTDSYLAELKVGILSRCKDIAILDVCHSVPVNEITSASYFLRNILDKLPPQSINLVSVNNYYQNFPQYIVFQKENKYFIGPDNGVFSLVFENIDEAFIIDREKVAAQGVNEMYAHAIACINHGLPFDEFAMSTETIDKRLAFRPVVNTSQIRGTIIHVDHYGNVITNISSEVFQKTNSYHKSFSVFYKPNEPIHVISKSYGEVSVGEVMCLFNSAGFLEIAVNCGNASQLLGLYKNETIQIDFFP